MTKGRRRGEGRHAIGERGGEGKDSRITQGDEAIEEEEERMSVVVEETENRNSFAGTGETTRREGICMGDAEKERRWSAMNGRITHRGDLEGEGMKLPAAVRWQTGPPPRCLESATVQGTPRQNAASRMAAKEAIANGRS